MAYVWCQFDSECFSASLSEKSYISQVVIEQTATYQEGLTHPLPVEDMERIT